MPEGTQTNDQQTPNEGGGGGGSVDANSPEFLAAVTAAAAESVAGLKTNRDQVLEEKRQLRTEFDAMKERFDGLGDFDTIKAMMERLANDEEARLISEGKTSEVIERRTEAMRRDSEARVTAATTRISELETECGGLRSTIVTLQVDSSIDQASAKLECAPTAIPDIRRAAREVFSLNAETNEIEARSDGVVQMGPDGKTPLTPAKWLEMQKAASPHWWGVSAGGGAGGGTGIVNKDGNSIPNFDQMKGKQKLSALMGGGRPR